MKAAARGVAIVGATLGVAAVAAAQTVDVQRPRTVVVGTPRTGARTDRMDGARSGRSATALPLAQNGGLRSEWRTVLAASMEVAPVVDDRATSYIVGTQGEVFAIARDGSEEWHASSGGIQPSAPTLLSDGTVVFTDAAGEAIAVREGTVRWRVRFGRPDAARSIRPAPLALDDGGVVVASARDLSVLDAGGHERGRALLPEPIAAPLVAAPSLGRIVAVDASGTVWTWAPGAAEATRVASFGGPIDDSPALADDHTLLAVAGGRLHLVAIDLIRGTATTRTVAPTGLWLGPPTMEGGIAFLLLQAPTSEFAMGIDVSGAETSRALVTIHPPAIASDGGAAPLVPLPHTPLLVDGAGTLAFATIDGGVGVVSAGVVDLLSDVCPLPPATAPNLVAPTAALLPLGPGVLLAACRTGTLVAIRE